MIKVHTLIGADIQSRFPMPVGGDPGGAGLDPGGLHRGVRIPSPRDVFGCHGTRSERWNDSDRERLAARSSADAKRRGVEALPEELATQARLGMPMTS